MILEDVQARPDTRGIALDEVGISGIRHPVSVYDARLGKQETVAEFDLAVRLGPEVKGAHMSRFVEVLRDAASNLAPSTLPGIVAALRRRLGADGATVRARFPYFLERVAPVTGARGLLDYQCELRAGDESYELSVRVPVTSVCPCSKSISDYGAHNQRGWITVVVDIDPDALGDEALWVEDLVDVAERSASAPVLPVVKRPDERHLTMQAYDNPVFVEDMVRNVVVALAADPRVRTYTVEAVNDESIHNHGAYARVSGRR